MFEVVFTPGEAIADPVDLLFGLPFDTPEQRVLDAAVGDVEAIEEVASRVGRQRALRLSVVAGARPTVTLRFEAAAGRFPDDLFEPTGGPHETPSADLVRLIADLAPATLTAADRVERIVRHVEERFTYGRREVGLGDDREAMPALACGTEPGTCVDTHAYAVAALRAAGLEAAYVSGVFFPGEAREAEPGHCWFVVKAPGAPHHWDVSHHLKYGLGPTRPVIDPLPGRRFALTCGRDLIFGGAEGELRLDRLSGFVVASGPDRGRSLETRATLDRLPEPAVA